MSTPSHNGRPSLTAEEAEPLIGAMSPRERRRLFARLRPMILTDLEEHADLMKEMLLRSLDLMAAAEEKLARGGERKQSNIDKVRESYRLQLQGVKVPVIAMRLGWTEKQLRKYRSRYRGQVPRPPELGGPSCGALPTSPGE